MAAETHSLPMKHPAVQQALAHFQEERWQEGLVLLDGALESHPFDPDLRTLRQQVQIRSRIDEYEAEEVEAARQDRRKKLIRRISMVMAFLVVVLLGSTSYAGVIRSSVTRQYGAILEDFSGIELALKFRNGQNLLRAGRAEEALVIFEEIKGVEPDYENLDMFIEQARGQLSIEGQYVQAKALVGQEEWEQALEILRNIDAQDSAYKDVPILIERAERDINLRTMLVSAQETFTAENWPEAVIRFEAIRLSDATFEAAIVEDRLFNSYLNAALAVVDDPEAELEELEIAQEYFQRALALRPQDEEVLTIRRRAEDLVRGRLVARYLNEAEAALVNQEDSVAALEIAQFYFARARALEPDNEEIALQADLATRYLQALTDFRSSLWDLVINNMAYIYSFDKEYASGTARQSLYDTHIIRGGNYLATGDFELGLEDYRSAVEIAQEIPDGGNLQVYEAQLKVAFALGLLFDYEGAVVMYQSAIETGDLRNRLEGSDPAFLSSITDADALAQDNSFRLAYIRYRDLFNANDLVYSEFIIHIVQEGEYLSQIANLYGSTIQAIAIANDIADPNRIIAGQDLIIPIFPEE